MLPYSGQAHLAGKQRSSKPHPITIKATKESAKGRTKKRILSWLFPFLSKSTNEETTSSL